MLLVSQQTRWTKSELCLSSTSAPSPPRPPPHPSPPPPTIDFDWLNPCEGINTSLFPWCNMDASPSDRAAALVAAMTLDEKSRTMVPFAPPIGRLRLPPLWTTDALHGAFSSPHYSNCTVFPQAISNAASFDTKCVAMYHSIIVVVLAMLLKLVLSPFVFWSVLLAPLPHAACNNNDRRMIATLVRATDTHCATRRSLIVGILQRWRELPPMKPGPRRMASTCCLPCSCAFVCCVGVLHGRP